MQNKEQTEVKYRHITDSDDLARIGFAKVYCEAFAELPYFEVFEPDWVVEHVWKPHIPHCVFTAEVSGEIVGMCCALPLNCDDSSVAKFIRAQAEKAEKFFPFDKTLYMSELAVLSSFRGLGIGTNLISKRFTWGKQNGFTHYCMRTAKDGSKSLPIYERIGAQKAPFIQIMDQVEIATESTERIFMYGQL